MENLYATLGLENITFEASDADIGRAYNQAALHFHPDKLGDKFTDKDKEVWLKIQKAYETLSDPAKRKKYDSTLPFDEEIPDIKKDKIDDSNFFEIFGKCFTNNARYSTIKPVPNIGEENTTIEEVQKFYKFWDSFKTWREFS
jgi:DnaJ family protein C protein 2